MGQATCCESSGNKKALLNPNEQNNTDMVTSIITQNNNQLNQFNNTYDSNLKLSQNEIANSITSLKNNESINKNKNLLSGVSNNGIPQLTSSYNINNKINFKDSNAPFTCVKTFEAHEDKPDRSGKDKDP